MKKIFIDSDIILDLMAKREPFYASAAKLFTYIEKLNIKVYTSPVVISNIYYILNKLKGRQFAINNIKKLRTIINIINVNEKIIDLALTSQIRDFEDAIQLYSAKENNIEFLITRNIRDYMDKELKITTADEFNRIVESAADFL